jgi:murein endopeptidase
MSADTIRMYIERSEHMHERMTKRKDTRRCGDEADSILIEAGDVERDTRLRSRALRPLHDFFAYQGGRVRHCHGVHQSGVHQHDMLAMWSTRIADKASLRL